MSTIQSHTTFRSVWKYIHRSYTTMPMPMPSKVLLIFLYVSSCSALVTQTLEGLNVAIVGAGPSGLLAAHGLLASGCSKVTLYEGRGDPRILQNIRDDRAYALGVGIRGRTAIRSIDDDDELWKAVKARGFPCDRFLLHPTPSFQICLRDEAETMTSSVQPGQEPSMLLFQTDLCSVMLDKLENRYHDTGRLDIVFNSKIGSAKLVSENINDENMCGGMELYDLVVGCDGVRSKVRASMEQLAPEVMKTTLQELPGIAKVITVPSSSVKLDSESVHLIFPTGSKVGAVTAFVEPTVKGSCILFAGKYDSEVSNDTPQLLSPGKYYGNEVAKEFGMTVREAFPLLAEQLTDDVIDHVSNQVGFSSATVKSNIYHCGPLAICGDAAHATGGVSGQGCNSALVDASVLVDCLKSEFSNKDASEQRKAVLINNALLKYSQKQVPEGSALYELSIGPDNGVSPGKKILSTLSALFDFIFKDKTTIQRILGTSLKPFSDIRRDREVFFDDKFPDQSQYDEKVVKMHERIQQQIHPSLSKVSLEIQ